MPKPVTQEAAGLIKTAEAMIDAKSGNDLASGTALVLADAIVAAAKKETPDDPVIQAINMRDGKPTWADVHAAMQAVVGGLTAP